MLQIRYEICEYIICKIMKYLNIQRNFTEIIFCNKQTSFSFPFPWLLTMFSNALPNFCGQSLRYKYKINKWKYSKNSSRNTAKTWLCCKRKYTHGHSVRACFVRAKTIYVQNQEHWEFLYNIYVVIIVKICTSLMIFH